MVPFTFEQITRSASFDAANTFPVSDAARATHESFESHLQRAAATTVDQPTLVPPQESELPKESGPASNEPPQNESTQNETVRRDADGTQRDDGDDDVRVDENAKATNASVTTAEKYEEEEAESDSASQYEVVIGANTAADERRVAIREVVSDGANDPEPESESGRVVAAKPNVASVSEEEAEIKGSLATKAEEPTDKEVNESGVETPAVSIVNVVISDGAEPTQSEPPARRAKPSETNEEVAAKESPEAAPTAETTIPADEPPQAGSMPRRHGQRGVAPNQRTHEPPDATPKPVAVDVIEKAVDSASEDRSQQRPHHRETDAPQPTGNTGTPDATTTTTGTPSRFAQHLLARTEDANARGQSITNADRARFVDRVARAVHTTRERNGTLRLRLSPPELGSLTLEVKVQGGVLSARVEADTSAARSLLLENLPLLRERLAEQGMRVDQFDVDLTDREAGGTPDGLPQNDQQHGHRPRAKATPLEPDDTAHTTSSKTTPKNGNEQLNIIV